MATAVRNLQKKSLWSSSGPSARLLFGGFLILTIGILGLTPKHFMGQAVIWPYASLWGAIGWGRVGLSFRPMILLILFGIAQDINTNAPLGCFVIVNLVTYGMSAAAADTFDLENSAILSVLIQTGLLTLGFLIVWLEASILQEHLVRLLPLLRSLIITGVTFAIVHKVFDLGRAPGRARGAD